LSASSWGLERYFRNPAGRSWSNARVVVNPPGTRMNNTFVTWQNHVYCTGARWLRIDPETLDPQILTPVNIPRSERFRHTGISAHYGFIAWNPGDVLYQVSIDAEQPAEKNMNAEFGFIPAEYRERHAHAVKAIREFGGSVDSDWTRNRGSLQVRLEGPMWKTFVYIPQTWRGGDDGLAVVKDLFNVMDLYIVEAPVTDKSLEHIGRVRTLQRLYLVDSTVTDAGLKHLWDLRKLLYLRLDGPAGSKHFTDAGLKHVSVLPIRALSLYGSGFTDDAIKELQNFRELLVVHNLETAISPAAQKSLRINRRPVRFTKGISTYNTW